MYIGHNILVAGIKVTTKSSYVTVGNASLPLSELKSELETLIGKLPLGLKYTAPYSIESDHFRLDIGGPLTFDTIFAYPIRISSERVQKVLSIKDQFGTISSATINVAKSESWCVSVICQVMRCEYLNRLTRLTEPSNERTTHLNAINDQMQNLYASPMILGPAPDELIGCSNGSIYLFRETIAHQSEFYSSVVFTDLPNDIQLDFQFARSSALSSLYALPGYTPGMNYGLEDALLNRGALGALNDSSLWLEVARTLDGSYVATPQLANLLAFDAPKLLALGSLVRRIRTVGEAVTLAELERKILSTFRVLKKIAGKSDLAIVSLSEIREDILQLIPLLTSDLSAQEELVAAMLAMSEITTSTLSYTLVATEGEKRLMRLAVGQLTSPLTDIPSIDVSVSSNVITFKRGLVSIGSLIVNGPFQDQVASFFLTRLDETQLALEGLVAMKALVDSADLNKTWSIDLTTGRLGFSYSIDDLRKYLVEYLIDSTRSLYQRS